jgi:Putative peptidoglycan binding domain
MQNDEEIQKFEQFFRDPDVEDGLLKPGSSGPACANIRQALRILGYDVEYGNYYDETLAKVILRFQSDNKHGSRDGFVGPGTRRLLITKLIETDNKGIFKRMKIPKDDYIETKITHYRELIKVYEKRRKILELQVAGYGSLHVPAHIQIELEEVSDDIRKYQQMIEELRKMS